MPEEKKRAWKIYAIDGGEDRRYWHEIGCAFQNADGSYNLKLYMNPGLNLQLRPPKDN